MHRLASPALAAGLLVASFATVGAVSATAGSGAGAATAQGLVVYSIGDQFANGGDLSKHSDIFSVRPDGTGRRQLTHVGARATAAFPTLSSDGREIAYESNVTGSYQIWSMHADGTHPRQVTHDTTYADLAPRWSADGEWIVFSRCDQPFGFPTLCDLDVIRADGTGRRRVVGGNRFHEFASFSPDGKRIVFSSDRAGFLAALWVVNVDGSGLRQLTCANVEAQAPDWSADGSRILFSDNCCRPHSNIWTVRPDGTHLQRLTNADANHNDFAAAFGPDGRGFVMDSDEAYADACCLDFVLQRADGKRVVLLKNAPDLVVGDWGASAPSGSVSRTGTLAPLPSRSQPRVPIHHLGPWSQLVPMHRTSAPAVPTSAAVPASNPHVSSSAGRIAFGDYMTHQLYAIDPDGSQLVQLTHTDTAHAAGDVNWSRDGRRIAYALFPSQVDAPTLWIANADGSGARRIPGETPGYRDRQPHFTGDGHIVFSRCQPNDGVCAIWIMRVDGSQRRALTPFRTGADEAIDFDPSVSADGTHVAFTRFHWHGITAEVHVIVIDGSHDRTLTPAWLEATVASFSPDDKLLTVTSQQPRLGNNIWTVSVASRQLQRLTFTSYPNNDLNSVFSPDGSRIVFVSDRRYHDFCCQDLFTMRPDGTGATRVSTGGLQGVLSIAWGPSPPRA